MINICIKDIVEATKGKLLCGDEKQQIDHLSIDSRSSQGNDLFIPIIGAKVDAHRFKKIARFIHHAGLCLPAIPWPHMFQTPKASAKTVTEPSRNYLRDTSQIS